MRAPVLALLLVLPACGPAPAPQVGTAPLALLPDGSAWAVTAIGGRSVPRDYGITLARSGMQISGDGGCNRYAGPVRATAAGLAFGPMAGTLMACADPAQMAADGAFHAALARVDGARAMPGGALALTAQGAPVIALAPLPRPAG